MLAEGMLQPPRGKIGEFPKTRGPSQRGLYGIRRDNEKENGNYKDYRDSIGFYRDLQGAYRGYVGKKMETTI